MEERVSHDRLWSLLSDDQTIVTRVRLVSRAPVNHRLVLLTEGLAHLRQQPVRLGQFGALASLRELLRRFRVPAEGLFAQGFRLGELAAHQIQRPSRAGLTLLLVE